MNFVSSFSAKNTNKAKMLFSYLSEGYHTLSQSNYANHKKYEMSMIVRFVQCDT